MKRGIQFAGIMLLVLALACLYVGAEGLLTIRPAAVYFFSLSDLPRAGEKYRRRPPGTAASDEDRLSGILPGDGWIGVSVEG